MIKERLRLRPGWTREVERDVIALGGVVFYVLVLGRALVGPYWDLAVPLVVLAAGLLVAHPLLRSTDLYLTRGLVVAVLVSRHYEDPVFATFAAVTYALMVLSATRLGRSRSAAGRGVALGAVLSAAGWLLAGAAE